MRDGDRGLSHLLSWKGLYTLLLLLLLVVSCRYIYNGFVLAFIPYPTAWDANHAYMFIPKMRAYHHGVYRFELSMRGFGGVRLAFISFRFNLFLPTNGFMGISPDTIAIEMNFRSGIYTLLFGT
ncbi:MAG: hypothetical protein Q8O99_03025 [bacterium]|nr:hypothetical protein [bacterium]